MSNKYIKSLFIPSELSQRIIALGFDKECLGKHMHLFYTDREVIDVIMNDDDDYLDSLYFEEGMVLSEAILWQQAFDWFTDKYDFYPKINRWYKNEKIREYWWHIDYVIKNSYDEGTTLYGTSSIAESKYFNSYQEARQSCLEKLTEIAENDQQ